MMKRKQALALLLICGILVAALAACGLGAGSDPSAIDPSPADDHQGEDPYTSLGSFTMVIAHTQPEDNPRDISLQKFAADVARESYGHVQVEVVGGGRLGTERDMLEQVMAGTIQGMRGGQYDYSPRLMMFTLPFLTSRRSQVDALLQSDLAQQVCQEAGEATGTVILNLCDAGGYRQFSNNVRPIRKPADLKGLRMRINIMTTTDMAFQEMGAETISIPYNDLYISLQSGVADGQENPWVNAENMEFYKVQKYFTEVNYQFHPDPFYVNAQWWSALPQQFRDILSRCATEMGAYNDQLVDQLSETSKEAIDNSSAEIYTPTDQELDAFREAMAPVYDQCVAAGICTAAELQEMQKIVSEAK